MIAQPPCLQGLEIKFNYMAMIQSFICDKAPINTLDTQSSEELPCTSLVVIHIAVLGGDTSWGHPTRHGPTGLSFGLVLICIPYNKTIIISIALSCVLWVIQQIIKAEWVEETPEFITFCSEMWWPESPGASSWCLKWEESRGELPSARVIHLTPGR